MTRRAPTRTPATRTPAAPGPRTSARRGTTPPRASRRRPPAWVPNQHGAWAMLVVPFTLGAILRLRAGEPAWFLVPLFGCWMAGYVAFFAASGWLKAPPVRRGAWVRPVLTASAIAGALGLLALALAGPTLALWIPAFLPLLVPALALAARRHERALLGGALTVAAASVMTLVARFPDPASLASDPGAPAALLASAAAFSYFFGTVLYVKTNIRERGSRPFRVASVAWHAAAAAVWGALAASGLVAVWWPVFFALTTVRAALVPLRTPAPTPRQIGVVEIGFCVVLVVCFALA